MTKQEFLAVVDAWVLGRVDDATQKRCAAFIANTDDAECLAAYEEAQAASLALALTVAPARVPDGVWTKIDAKLNEARPPSIVPLVPPRRNPVRVWQALAAALAVLAIGLQWRTVQLQRGHSQAIDVLANRMDDNGKELTLCQRTLSDQRVRCEQTQDLVARLSAPGVKMMKPDKMMPEAPNFMFGMTPAGQAFVFGDPMPTQPGYVYELWVIPKKGAPKPAGTFAAMFASSAVTFEHDMKHDEIAALAVSREPAPGGPSPTQVLLMAKL